MPDAGTAGPRWAHTDLPRSAVRCASPGTVTRRIAAAPPAPGASAAPRTDTDSRRAHNRRHNLRDVGASDPVGHRCASASSCKRLRCTRAITGCHRFLLSNFKHYLTLFSKFFSPFPHGTCSLSVSRRYLALDEIYHPFRVAIPNNSTLGRRVVRGGLRV